MRIYVYYSWSWRWRKKATSTRTTTVLEGEALEARAKGTKDPDLDRGLPPNTPVSWKTSRSSSGVMPEMSRVTCSTPLTVSRETAS